MKIKKFKKAVFLDIDDTTFPFTEVLIHLYNEKNGTVLVPDDLTNWNFSKIEIKDCRGNITKGEDIRKLFNEYENHGLYTALQAYPQAKQAIQLLQEWNYEIFLITARDVKYKLETEISLMMAGIKDCKLIFDWDKCKHILALSDKYKIVAFADDNTENVKAVKKLCNLPFNFLISKAHNKNLKLEKGIIRVNSLLEIVRYL